MLKRLRQILIVTVCAIGGGIVTLMLSWLLQYACSLLLGQVVFSIDNRDINQLAVVTVLAVAVISLVLPVMRWLLIDEDSILTPALMACGIIGGAIGIAPHIFPGTPVSNLAAQIIYGFLVLLWGIAVFYVFFSEEESED